MASEPTDRRLYVHDPDSWQAKVRRRGDRIFCYSKRPEDDGHHQIGVGELYVQKGDERLCLTCAIRLGAVTANRLHWQTRGELSTPKPIA